MKSSIPDKAYKNNEHDASVKERLLLRIRVSFDKQHIKAVAFELHRSRAWAYKWYKRYNNEWGLEEIETNQQEVEDHHPSWMKIISC